MCGISFLISDHPVDAEYLRAMENIQPRGPDYSNRTTMKMGDSGLYLTMSFHRLSVVDRSVNGAQPFMISIDDEHEIFCIANAEIFNHEDIREFLKVDNYDANFKSSSDCEVLPYLYHHVCGDKTENIHYEKFFCDYLSDNEYALVIVHHNKSTDMFTICVGRDPYGVRPLYSAYCKEKGFICFSSELKGIPYLDHVDYCDQFTPMSYLNFQVDGKEKSSIAKIVERESYQEKLYLDSLPIFSDTDEGQVIKSLTPEKYMKVLSTVRQSLTKAVKYRLMSDRPLGAFLSGGLDSSLVCAIAAKILKEDGKALRTFSVGMEGSTDEYFAKKVAKYIGSEHTHFLLSKNEFQAACKDTIWKVESFDCTTVRASVCQMLCSKYVAETTDIKVLLVGDGSDELLGGYVYFRNAPTPREFHNECVRLVSNIHRYDGQRSDRLIASYGMETRSPFQEDCFVRTILGIDPELRIPQDTPFKSSSGVIGKCLLRSAFIEYLPDDCLWRVKEAFSDGVSGEDDSWYLASKKKAEELYTDEEFAERIQKYPKVTPTSKEELYYREVFGELFSENVSNVIPYRWMPKPEWVDGDVTDPSARVLKVYETTKPTQ